MPEDDKKPEKDEDLPKIPGEDKGLKIDLKALSKLGISFKEILEIVTAAQGIKELLKIGIDVFGDLANAFWDPKWAEAQAKWYSTFYNTLVNNGVSIEAATMMTLGQIYGLRQFGEEISKAMSSIANAASTAAQKTRRTE